MKKIVFITLFLSSYFCFSQNIDYKLPNGFTETDYGFTFDIDKDGSDDLVVVLNDGDGMSHLFVFLSTLYSVDESYQFCELSGMVHDFFIHENNIFQVISSLGGASKYINNESLKFKYDVNTKKMITLNKDYRFITSNQ